MGMHFYINAGRPDHVAEYKKSRKGMDVPRLPLLYGNGSYIKERIITDSLS